MGQRNLVVTSEQTARISLGGQSIALHFFPFRELMYVDISIGSQSIVYGKRVLPNQWLLPNYVAEGRGNMRFETYASDGQDYVWWEGFNKKFRFCAYNVKELAELESKQEEA